jgi:hypothetical protein
VGREATRIFQRLIRAATLAVDRNRGQFEQESGRQTAWIRAKVIANLSAKSLVVTDPLRLARIQETEEGRCHTKLFIGMKFPGTRRDRRDGGYARESRVSTHSRFLTRRAPRFIKLIKLNTISGSYSGRRSVSAHWNLKWQLRDLLSETNTTRPSPATGLPSPAHS